MAFINTRTTRRQDPVAKISNLAARLWGMFRRDEAKRRTDGQDAMSAKVRTAQARKAVDNLLRHGL